jgi:hypothetical protein
VSVTGRTGATGWLSGAACNVRAAPPKMSARARRVDGTQKGITIPSDYTRSAALVGDKIAPEIDVIKQEPPLMARPFSPCCLKKLHSPFF